ncbi:MAG: universal stress protein [Xanthomonadaceae bacterium]|jgi:nucleotide-binding universal stress UspA family protein|nr:universal stress protein [Xanthomonadaceae bacterium]MDE2317740.1 universal stress protein [Xanthomonadaceae bacterium]
MYSHILLACGDSRVARHAMDLAVALAAQQRASLHAVYVLAPPPAVAVVADAILGDPASGRAARRADRALERVRERAARAGVPCTVERVFDRRPYAAIAGTAAGSHCDLIVMGAHAGPSGSQAARKLILNCDVPVLVCR